MANPIKTCNTCGRQYTTPEDFLKQTSRWRICDRGNLWFNCGCQSTNMIIKGKFDWYSPDKAMSEEASTVFNQLPGLKELPHIPNYVMQLQEMLQKESTSSKQLAEVTRKAPLLASTILKNANQMCSTPGANIESLEHAISYLGIKAMGDLVLVAALNTFEFKCKTFKSEDFWDRSFLCGKITEFLSKRFASNLLPDEAYIAGTLANVGKVVLAITNPDMADKLASDIKDVKVLGTWLQAEERHNTHSHCVLGEIGAMFWGLPEYVIDSISAHHRIPQSLVEASYSLNDLVVFANQLTHWILFEPSQMDEQLLEACYEKFGLGPKDAEALVEEIMNLKPAAA